MNYYLKKFYWFTLFCLSTLSALAMDTKHIETARGQVEIKLPIQRIAVFDWAILDSLMTLGVNVGATTAPVQIDYLQPIFQQAEVVGTLFEPDYEKLYQYKADLIITGGPNAANFDALTKLAPTIDLTVDNQNIRQTGLKHLASLGAIFDKQEQSQKLIKNINLLFDQTRSLAKGKGNGLVISITGNKISAFGENSRLSSWIHQDIGIPAVNKHLNNSGHGEVISFEYIQKYNPDWLFVLDRTSSLGQKGLSAQAVLDNPLIRTTKAWRNKQIIYMPNANYIAAGGATQLLQAVQQLKDAFQ
ncbi:siderophore ABC transporter substrate-binding protein [Ursidibacter arcticus]